MKPQVKTTIDGNIIVENSYVDPSTLTKAEYDVWKLKDIVLKCIGGLPDNIDDIRIAEVIRYENDSTLIEGVCRWGEREIVVSRSILYRKESFLGVLTHELAHAKSEAADLTKEFEDELTDMLGYLATSLACAVNNDSDKVTPAMSLENSCAAYISCKCPSCGSTKFDTNEDKSFAKCASCGREFHGGYMELVSLNRAMIAEYDLKQQIEMQLNVIFG